MERCLRCQKPLGGYNTRKFCGACQSDPKAEFPVYVIVDEDGSVSLDWWSNSKELDEKWKEGQQQIPIMISITDFIDLNEISDLLQKKAEETEDQFADSNILSVVLPSIVQRALKRL